MRTCNHTIQEAETSSGVQGCYEMYSSFKAGLRESGSQNVFKARQSLYIAVSFPNRKT